MHKTTRIIQAIGGGALLGAVCAAAYARWGVFAHVGGLEAVSVRVFDTVGITLIGLAPLGVWTAMLFARHLFRGGATRQLELNYGFSARNAVLLGLLGTVISLAAAGGQLAEGAARGSSAAILQIAPLVSQALWSTIIGIVIALIADVGLHLIEKNRTASNATVS